MFSLPIGNFPQGANRTSKNIWNPSFRIWGPGKSKKERFLFERLKDGTSSWRAPTDSLIIYEVLSWSGPMSKLLGGPITETRKGLGKAECQNSQKRLQTCLKSVFPRSKNSKMMRKDWSFSPEMFYLSMGNVPRGANRTSKNIWNTSFRIWGPGKSKKERFLFERLTNSTSSWRTPSDSSIIYKVLGWSGPMRSLEGRLQRFVMAWVKLSAQT